MKAGSGVPDPAVIDFETLPIEDRPHYPPCPVGVSIILPGGKERYYAWGHLEGNNCSWGEARDALVKAYACKDGILFQNGKFDLDVSEVHMGLKIPEWQHIHDTMLLLFLDDPHQTELGLKPAAARLLNEPPEERDAVVDWLMEHQPLKHLGVRLTRGKQGEHYAGAYVAFAPASVTGPYANGDTRRTRDIFKLLWPKTKKRGMLGAYDRERELLPILLQMERRGIQLDHARIRVDVARYQQVQRDVDSWILKRLKAPSDLNLDSGDQLMAAMLKAGVADEDLALRTTTGKLSTSKDSLIQAVSDKSFLGVMRYRAALKTILGTFMEPWLREADRTGGLISTSWNQVRAPSGDSNVGTRTGRLSASRFMNMPKEFNAIFRHEEKDPKAAKKLPACPIKGLPSLPVARSYICPFEGHVLIDRDYSQQEPRILAHFDGGDLMDKYNAEPWIDFHDYAKMELEKYGLFYERKPVKNTNLGLIYGMGAPKLAVKNDMSVQDSKVLRDAILKLYPGLKDMYKQMKLREQQNEPVRTWGGREYYCEPPRLVDGKIRHFDYKLVNVLIQGSAADCTKEAVLRWNREVHRRGKQHEWFLILTVHDQLTASVPIDEIVEGMALLQEVMQSVEFDVPMLSEGAYSFTNWADLKEYDAKGKISYAHSGCVSNHKFADRSRVRGQHQKRDKKVAAARQPASGRKASRSTPPAGVDPPW